MTNLLKVGLMLSSILIILAVALFVWPGWMINEPVAGCTSPQWENPSGDLEVFTDGSISPDGNWFCTAETPNGPFSWIRAEIPVVEAVEVTPVVEESEIVCDPCNTASTPVDCNPCDTPEEIVQDPEPTPGWIGDDFGPEKAFPNKIEGPAIGELWNPNTELCALVKINEDEVLDWSHNGAYWEADSQEALNARWPHHRQEYLANNSNCQISESASLIP